MHTLKPFRERVAPGRLNLVHLLSLVSVLLFTTTHLLRAQCTESSPNGTPSNAATVSVSPINSNNTVPSNTTTTLTATVTRNGAPVTIGTVTFCNQGVFLGTGHVNSNGVATFNIELPPGGFRIGAHYSGSSQAGPGWNSPGMNVSVVGSDAMTLASSGNASGYTLTATLTSNLPTGPDGPVSFIDQTTGETIGTANFANQVNTSDVKITTLQGDFDGNGTRDTVGGTFIGGGAGTNGDAAFVVTFTRLDGTTYQVTSEPFGPTQDPYGIVVLGDFNNDGLTDMVVQDTNTNLVTVLLSQGNGQFSIAGQFAAPPLTNATNNNFYVAAVVGDFNNDGNLDMITANTSGMTFYAGDGAGNLAAGQVINTTATAPALVGDYLDNGNLDFFSYRPDFFSNTTPTSPNDFDGTTLYVGAGDGTTFTGQSQSATFGTQAPPANILSMVTANWFDFYTCPGLAYATPTTVTIMGGSCNGFFQTETNTVPDTGQTFTAQFNIGGSWAVVQLEVADVNGDGLPDLIAFAGNPGSHGGPAKFNMIVFTNMGPGYGPQFVMSATAPSDSSGTNFPNPPVPFTTPVLGQPLPSSTEYEAGEPFLTSGTSSTGTATLSNVTLPPGNHNIVAYYPGQAGTPGATSNTVALSGSGIAPPPPTPTIGTLAAPNGSAKVNNGVLQLTDGGQWEAGSAWTPNPVDVQAFTTTFTFQLSNAQADGFTFAVQNNSPQALGGNGGMLGYGGIPNSIALKFDLYNNAGEGVDSIGVYTDGATPTTPADDMTSSGVDLHSGHVMQAQLLYDGYFLHVTITDTTTNASFTQSYAANIQGLYGQGAVGSPTAYVGFTGGTGGLTATQQILSWTYTPLPFYPHISNVPALLLNGGATVVGQTNPALQLIDGGTFEARSAWFPNPVPITQFTNTFTFVGSNANADGITFTIQNAGPSALGPAGGGLGYGALDPGGPVGITNSMAIKFDLYNNDGEGNDSTGIFTAGDSPTIPAIDLSSTGIDLHSGDPINVNMSYDGSTITMALYDTVTKTRWTHYFYGVDLPTLVGGPTAYIGFTGGTGGLSATEDINGWTYLPSNIYTSPVLTY